MESTLKNITGWYTVMNVDCVMSVLLQNVWGETFARIYIYTVKNVGEKLLMNERHMKMTEGNVLVYQVLINYPNVAQVYRDNHNILNDLYTFANKLHLQRHPHIKHNSYEHLSF